MPIHTSRCSGNQRAEVQPGASAIADLGVEVERGLLHEATEATLERGFERRMLREELADGREVRLGRLAHFERRQRRIVVRRGDGLALGGGLHGRLALGRQSVELLEGARTIDARVLLARRLALLPERRPILRGHEYRCRR
jgi:hypothetical protein